jgi:hypothetical protein
MTDADRSDRRSSGSASLGIGIVFGVILLLGLGWLGFESYRSSRVVTAVMTQGPALAAAWAEDVRAGRLDAAYGATTAAYRSAVDRQAFERWVAGHPELKLTPRPRGYGLSNHTVTVTVGISGIRFTNPPPRMTYRTEYTRPGEDASVLTIVVTSEGGPPLVDHAEFEPEPPSRP